MSDPDPLEPVADESTRELESLRDGERAVTEKFVREHLVWMLTVANRILRDRSLAEDAAQNAFAAIFSKLDSFNERSALTTWMHRILVNEALMLLRKRKRSGEELIDPLMPVFDGNGCRIEDDWPAFQTPETIMQQSQSSAKVIELIDRLPEKYRIVLILRDIEELSSMEAADILEISVANLKVRLHRARAALKKLLEPMIKGQVL